MIAQGFEQEAAEAAERFSLLSTELSGREATREPHVDRQPGVRANAMATDDHGAIVRQGKMHDGRCGFEVGVRDLVERNPTNNADDLGAEQAALAVVPDPGRDRRVRSNLDVH